MKTKAKQPKRRKANPKLTIEVTDQLLSLFADIVGSECEGIEDQARHGNWEWAMEWLEGVKTMLAVLIAANYKLERP
jgi:hypothetical protein